MTTLSAHLARLEKLLENAETRKEIPCEKS